MLKVSKAPFPMNMSRRYLVSLRRSVREMLDSMYRPIRVFVVAGHMTFLFHF
jgi:hypothetical protein